MKHVCITYHMTHKIKDGRETVEGLITLPMCDDSAQDLLTKGEESPTYLAFVHDILEGVSGLLGLDYVGFCSAKLANDEEADDEEEPQARYRVTWCDFQGREHEIKCHTLQSALAEIRYLEGCLTQGPVKMEEIEEGEHHAEN